VLWCQQLLDSELCWCQLQGFVLQPASLRYALCGTYAWRSMPQPSALLLLLLLTAGPADRQPQLRVVHDMVRHQLPAAAASTVTGFPTTAGQHCLIAAIELCSIIRSAG
jgi:hypothetical protein